MLFNKKSIILLLSLNYSLVGAQTIKCPEIPDLGMTMKFDQVDDTVTISNNGPWDFSSIVSGINYEMKVLPLDSSIHASNYPGATHVLKSANGEFFLSYDSSGLKSFGKVSTTTTSSYANALTLIPFPFNSTLSHLDSIASTLVWNGLTANVTDKVEVQGVESGNIIMPDGNSYQNAIMLSTIRTTVTGPSPIGTYLSVEEHSKVFWLPGYALPVIEVMHVFSNDNLVFKRSLFLHEQQTVNTNEMSLLDVNVFPNPVTNMLKIIQPMKNSHLYLFNLLGEAILDKSLIIGENHIDISALPSGIYTYKITREDVGLIIEEKIIKI